eukprot:1541363-Rhodomonas_salina.2
MAEMHSLRTLLVPKNGLAGICCRAYLDAHYLMRLHALYDFLQRRYALDVSAGVIYHVSAR